MSRRPEPPTLTAIVLAGALIGGVLVAWSPRYWPLSVGIACLAIAALCWAVFPSKIRLPWAAIPVGFIGLWGFVQILFHRTVIPSFTFRVSLTWLTCAVAFFLGAQVLRTSRNRDLFLTIVLWSVTALALEALLQLYSQPVRVFGIIPAEGSVIGTVIYANFFAALMELGAPLALWQIKLGRLLPGGLAFATMFAATVASGSRAGFVLLLAELVIFVLLMFSSGRWPLRKGTAAAVSVVLLIAWAVAIGGTERLWDKLQEKHPYQLRRELLDSTLAMIRHSPWEGYGLGTWRAVYPQFATLDIALIANEAHNDWVQWASDGGLPFMFLMAGLALWLSAGAVGSVWGMGLVAVLLHCWVDYPMRSQPIAFLWFTLAGAISVKADYRAGHLGLPMDPGDTV